MTHLRDEGTVVPAAERAVAIAVLSGLVLATAPAASADPVGVQVERSASLSLTSTQCTPLPREEQRCTQVEVHASVATGLEVLDLSVLTYVADPHGTTVVADETGQVVGDVRLRVGRGLHARLRATTVDLGSRRVVVSAVADPERPAVTNRTRDRRQDGTCVVRTRSRERSADAAGVVVVDAVRRPAAVGRVETRVVRTHRSCR